MQRDAIDFATEPIGQLFRKMFLPTLIAMVSMVVLNITDGAFVGHGVGSDALAAVNIVAPIFLLTGGLGLMFGIGSSVVVSVHLSKGNQKAANINMTQGIVAAGLLGVVLGALFFCFQRQVCLLFGCSEPLMEKACSYLRWVSLLTPFNMMGMVGMFFVRLDGSPRISMTINCSMAGLNILLDWICIYPLQMGLEGAAIATTTAFTLGNIPLFLYLFRYNHTIQFYRLKMTAMSMRLMMRNLLYQMKIGLSGLIGEFAIAGIMIVGNYVFIHYLGEDGVAAYSVACYCLPIVFMLANAIVQSVQPIVSYAHGVSNHERLRQARRIALGAAVVSGLGGMLLLGVGADFIASTFLDRKCHAFTLCREGLPYFSVATLFAAVNVVAIGYMQSTEQATRASVFTLLRGIVFALPLFILMPMLLGVPGLWLAVPSAEALTLIIMTGCSRIKKC